MSYCGRCATVVERGDLFCAICGLATPAHVEGVEHVSASILRCDGCGAAVSYDPTVQAPRCAFCAQTMHVEGVEDPPEQCGWYLWFTVAPAQARSALGAWMGSLGFFRPSDLRSASTVEALQPIWWTGWAFDADALVSWTADSDADTMRAAWAPHSGQLHLHFDDIIVPATRGLTSSECKALAPGYFLGQGAPESSAALSAAQGTSPTVEQFDVQRSAARAFIADRIEELAMERIGPDIPGSKFRKLKVTALLEKLETRRCAFPAYVLAYRYKNRLYRAVLSGQDATRITGSAPYSIAKIVGVAAAVIAALFLLVAIFGR